MSREEYFENVFVESGGFHGLVVRVYWREVKEYNSGAVVLVVVEITGGKLAIQKSGKLAPWSMLPTSCLCLTGEQRMMIRDHLVSLRSRDGREHVIIGEV